MPALVRPVVACHTVSSSAADIALDAMSGERNAELWHVDALLVREEWGRIRSLAAEALSLLS